MNDTTRDRTNAIRLLYEINQFLIHSAAIEFEEGVVTRVIARSIESYFADPHQYIPRNCFAYDPYLSLLRKARNSASRATQPTSLRAKPDHSSER